MTKCRKVKLSKINAKIVLMKMQFKDKGAKRIYYCNECNAWHITSQEYNANRNGKQDGSPVVD